MASSRRRSLRKDDDKIEINISPMIDMVFILLIFFIVTTVFVEEFGLEANRPEPGTEQNQDDDNKPIVLHVTRSGEVEFNNSQIGLQGVRRNVQANVKNKETAIIVEADPDASSALMIRVMDEARNATNQENKVTIQARQ